MLAMWPALPGFNIEAVDYIDDKYRVVARVITERANCPNCKEQSSSVHSWYKRVPHDLPSCGTVLRLCLRVRRFFCQNEACPRQIFCERLPQLIKKYARRTQRLAKSLTILALALGGKEGERVVSKIGMPASRDTLLRLIRKQSDPELPAPRVIGVDDWAFRKGHTYGTLLCDLEQGKVIDLLPDREADSLAEWLKTHPTIEIVTRVRSKAYAAGVAEGAPDAIQVADRWHLASNLVDALEATLARHPNCLQGAPIQEKPANTRSRVGFTGGRTTVRNFVRQLRQASGLPPKGCHENGQALVVDPTKQPPTLRSLTWLILKQPDKRSEKDERMLAQMSVGQSRLITTIEMARKFSAIVRQQKSQELDDWLDQASHSNDRIWKNFAASLKQDYDAVRAALLFQWSNGPTEGHVNRLKCVKRQMYGRANLDLLRQRLVGT